MNWKAAGVVGFVAYVWLTQKGYVSGRAASVPLLGAFNAETVKLILSALSALVGSWASKLWPWIADLWSDFRRNPQLDRIENAVIEVRDKVDQWSE